MSDETPHSSAVNSELLGVSIFPGGSDGRSSVGGLVTLLSETSLFLTGGGKSSKLSFVVFLRNDPVDSWVLSNGFVSWIDDDDFEELVGSVLTAPVRVEDSHVGASSSDLLLTN